MLCNFGLQAHYGWEFLLLLYALSLPSFLSGGFSFVVASVRQVRDWSCDGSREFVPFTDLGVLQTQSWAKGMT